MNLNMIKEPTFRAPTESQIVSLVSETGIYAFFYTNFVLAILWPFPIAFRK